MAQQVQRLKVTSSNSSTSSKWNLKCTRNCNRSMAYNYCEQTDLRSRVHRVWVWSPLDTYSGKSPADWYTDHHYIHQACSRTRPHLCIQ